MACCLPAPSNYLNQHCLLAQRQPSMRHDFSAKKFHLKLLFEKCQSVCSGISTVDIFCHMFQFFGGIASSFKLFDLLCNCIKLFCVNYEFSKLRLHQFAYLAVASIIYLHTQCKGFISNIYLLCISPSGSSKKSKPKRSVLCWTTREILHFILSLTDIWWWKKPSHAQLFCVVTVWQACFLKGCLAFVFTQVVLLMGIFSYIHQTWTL